MLTHSAVPKTAIHPSLLKNSAHIPNLLGEPEQPAATAEADVEDGSLDRLMQVVGAVAHFPRKVEVVHEAEAADRLYKVVSGTVCACKILNDGRRQIGGFYMAGDIFGLEGGESHTMAAEAITDVKLLIVKKSVLAAVATRNPSIASQLLLLTARELARVQDRVLLVSSKSAQERVVGFLLEMSKRAVASLNMVELPMSRQDIADYLGLTIETVSRTLWSLESCGAIEISTSRRIVLRSRSALARLQQ
jgi:CRP-like cAMP-binding protein